LWFLVFGFWFLVCSADTQRATQVPQGRIQVVRSNLSSVSPPDRIVLAVCFFFVHIKGPPTISGEPQCRTHEPSPQGLKKVSASANHGEAMICTGTATEESKNHGIIQTKKQDKRAPARARVGKLGIPANV